MKFSQKHLKFLKWLENKGIIFCVNDYPGGMSFISAEDIPDFIYNWYKFMAKRYEMTEKQIWSYVDQQASARCSAITKKGKRCKNSPKNCPQSTFYNPKEWLVWDGQYCTFHEDGIN